MTLLLDKSTAPAHACAGADGYVIKEASRSFAKKYHWKERSYVAEVRALRAVESPWIVQLVACSSESRCCWQALYDGDLLQVLTDVFPRVVQDGNFKLHVATSLLRALETCHAAGIVHRDVKPENILFKAYPRGYVLCDFGRSVFLADGNAEKPLDFSTREVSVPFSGTYSYASPEALMGKCRCSNDCWSAGVVIYTIIEKQMPYDDPSGEEEKTLPRIPTLDKSGPWPSWGEVLLRGLFCEDHTLRWDASRALRQLASTSETSAHLQVCFGLQSV
jgi:serine/threonine protein kinase